MARGQLFGGLAAAVLLIAIATPLAQADRELKGVLGGGGLTTYLPIAIPSVRLKGSTCYISGAQQATILIVRRTRRFRPSPACATRVAWNMANMDTTELL